jgi:hypothetical protein
MDWIHLEHFNFPVLSNIDRIMQFLLISGFVKKQHALFKEQQ